MRAPLSLAANAQRLQVDLHKKQDFWADLTLKEKLSCHPTKI